MLLLYIVIKRLHNQNKTYRVTKYLSLRNELSEELFYEKIITTGNVSRETVTKILKHIDSHMKEYLETGKIDPDDLLKNLGYDNSDGISTIYTAWDTCLNNIALEIDEKISKKDDDMQIFTDTYGTDVIDYVDYEIPSVRKLIKFVDDVEKQFDIKILEQKDDYTESL